MTRFLFFILSQYALCPNLMILRLYVRSHILLHPRHDRHVERPQESPIFQSNGEKLPDIHPSKAFIKEIYFTFYNKLTFFQQNRYSRTVIIFRKLHKWEKKQRRDVKHYDANTVISR